MLVPLVLYFLRPCAIIANYFEKPLINFLPSDPFINFLYSRNILVVVSSTAFILRIGLMDRPEAQLISCWNRCCNLAGIFIVVKSALVFSREEFLG